MVNQSVSENLTIKAGVPQGTILWPRLYALHKSDLPTITSITAGTFGNGTVSLGSNSNSIPAVNKTQNYLDQLQIWLEKWRIEIGEMKPMQTFYFKKKSMSNNKY